MEAVTIDGVEFIKASLLAKQNRYTADYIGQLCRGRKVRAKLVGRTWYVDPNSLSAHKVSRFTKKTAEKTVEKAIDDNVSRLAVHQVLLKNAVKNSPAVTERKGNFLKRVDWKAVKYEQDVADLLPGINNTKAYKLDVDLAEPEKLMVTAETKPTKMTTEPLPEVSLSGTLRIKSLDVNFDNSLNSIDSSVANEDTVQLETVAKDHGKKILLDESKAEVAITQKKASKMTDNDVTYDVPVHVGGMAPVAKIDFTPKRASLSQDDERDQSKVLGPMFVLLVFGALLAVSLWVLEFEVLVTGSTATKSLVFAP